MEQAAACGFVWGQVFDLPDPRLIVTEHRMLKVPCACGQVTTAPAPPGVSAPCQYGPGVSALAVYGLVHQHLPSQRLTEAAADLVGAEISEGFADSALKRAAAALGPFRDRVTALLHQEKVAHFD